ncbi:MAG: LamG-like jellyroll fold domain-containing protein [bacterium]
MKRTVLVVFATLAAVLMVAAAAARANLLLWNTLGSRDEVENSAVGPDFFIEGTVGFQEGVSGGAFYSTGHWYLGNRIVIPESGLQLNPEEGTVQAWVMYPRDPIVSAYNYSMFSILDGVYQGGADRDPTLGEQVVCWVGDGVTGVLYTYYVDLNFAGPQGDPVRVTIPHVDDTFHPGEWHNVAIVWKRTGIAGSANTLRVYLDGVLRGTNDSPDWGAIPDVGRRHTAGKGEGFDDGTPAYVLDELEVWDVATIPTGTMIYPSPPSGCISLATHPPCTTVPMSIVLSDTAAVRGFSASFTLSPELALCSPGAIVEGTYLSSVGATMFHVVPHGGGSYTVDAMILGSPCGATDATGTLFTVGVESAAEDGTGTIKMDSVLLRDCRNDPIPVAAGEPASILIDLTPPEAVTDVAAMQRTAGNQAGCDTTGITVTFTAPEDAAVTEVWAAPFGNYPEYDDPPNGGSAPAPPTYPPAPPWRLTSVTASGQDAYLAARDFWYFAAFAKDACGNASLASNVAGGVLNYHLGDVTDGAVEGHGDNVVNDDDTSLLGAHYGATLSPSDPQGYLDVGPTTDSTALARPVTDSRLDFEDAMVFAANYGQVSRASAARSRPAGLPAPSIALRLNGEGERVIAHLVLTDNGNLVKGVHASVSFDPASLELVRVSPGTLLAQQGPTFLGNVDEAAGMAVDIVRLGQGETLSGDGEVAVMEFRRLSGTSLPILDEAALRDVSNRPAGAGNEGAVAAPLVPPSLPTRIELVGARPNPFAHATEILFRLPASTRVALHVYDVTGRLVRALQDGVLDPGEHVARWDGRTAAGSLAASGIYFYTFEADAIRETRKLICAR